jgi:hypothetical protein
LDIRIFYNRSWAQDGKIRPKRIYTTLPRTIIIMASSGGSLPVFEKLNGSDNYNNWTFLMELYLAHEDLWECVELTTTAASGQAAVVDV